MVTNVLINSADNIIWSLFPPGTDPGIYRCGLIPTSEQTGHKPRPNTCNVSDTCAAKLAVKRTLSCFPCDQEGLPFVWKTQKFRGDLKWNSSPRWKFSGKGNAFRGITFFPFLPTRPKFSVLFVCITSTRLQVERKRKIYWYFCKLYNSIPFLFSMQKKIPLPFDGNFSPQFLYKR